MAGSGTDSGGSAGAEAGAGSGGFAGSEDGSSSAGSAGAGGGGVPGSEAGAGGGGVPNSGAGGGGGSAFDGFEPVPGLDVGGRARRVGASFLTVGQALASNGDGSGWLLWRSYSDPDFSESAIHLDHFAANGAFDRSSRLATVNPDGLVLHSDDNLTAYRNRCGVEGADTCFYRAADDDVAEHTWPAAPRSFVRYELDHDGNVVDSLETTAPTRNVVSASADGSGVYVVSLQGGYVLSRLDDDFAPLWSTAILPAVVPPYVPIDAPLEDLLRASALARQWVTPPVAIAGGVVVATTATRGTLSALSAEGRFKGDLPEDPRCPDLMVLFFPEDGSELRSFHVPTPECGTLLKLAVVDNHAVVASVVAGHKEPEPNDTSQYDIGLIIVDLATGTTTKRLFGDEHDNIVHSVTACGTRRVCLAGMTGAKSVDTGSTVTEGNGFVLPVNLDGEAGTQWILTSPRHSEIQHVAPREGGILFFASVNAPITHTADSDRWLGFNEGMLGLIEGL